MIKVREHSLFPLFVHPSKHSAEVIKLILENVPRHVISSILSSLGIVPVVVASFLARPDDLSEPVYIPYIVPNLEAVREISSKYEIVNIQTLVNILRKYNVPYIYNLRTNLWELSPPINIKNSMNLLEHALNKILPSKLENVNISPRGALMLIGRIFRFTIPYIVSNREKMPRAVYLEESRILYGIDVDLIEPTPEFTPLSPLILSNLNTERTLNMNETLSQAISRLVYTMLRKLKTKIKQYENALRNMKLATVNRALTSDGLVEISGKYRSGHAEINLDLTLIPIALDKLFIDEVKINIYNKQTSRFPLIIFITSSKIDTIPPAIVINKLLQVLSNYIPINVKTILSNIYNITEKPEPQTFSLNIDLSIGAKNNLTIRYRSNRIFIYYYFKDKELFNIVQNLLNKIMPSKSIEVKNYENIHIIKTRAIENPQLKEPTIILIEIEKRNT